MAWKPHTTLTSFAISTPVLKTGENERMTPLDYHPLSPSGPLGRVESLLSLVVRLVRAEPVETRALFFLVTGVGRHSWHVRSGRGLHELLIGRLAAFVEQYVQGFFVNACLGTLDFRVLFVGGIDDGGAADLWDLLAVTVEDPATYLTSAYNVFYEHHTIIIPANFTYALICLY